MRGASYGAIILLWVPRSFLLCKELNGEEQEAIHIYFEHNLENETH